MIEIVSTTDEKKSLWDDTNNTIYENNNIEISEEKTKLNIEIIDKEVES